jgi:hypothetical protein
MGRTRSAKYRIVATALLVLAALLVPFEPATAAADPVLVAAGDLASCASTGDEATAALADQIEGTLVSLGDFRYGNPQCYEESWGRHRYRIRPAMGNHEYTRDRESWYFPYFGQDAGPPDKGYYSYDRGAWHIVALNSNCVMVGGCGPNSPQGLWLRNNLARTSKPCTLAYWHHPRFSSDRTYGDDADTGPLWETLYAHGAEVVLAAHAHVYERFAPQTPKGAGDAAFGIRQFTVGTGGASHYRFGRARPNSEVRDAKTYGLLKLTLHKSGYDWQFVPEPGRKFTDSGTGACHGRPPTAAQPAGDEVTDLPESTEPPVA